MDLKKTRRKLFGKIFSYDDKQCIFWKSNVKWENKQRY